ncbi:MAG TPA: DUF2059 domain-containing protein [Acidobacteriaceae bacterium]
MNRSAAIAALVLALTLPAVARADAASQRAKAEELANLNNTQKTVQLIAANITTQIDTVADRAAGPDATADQKAKIEDFKKQAAQLIDANLGWDAMKPGVVDLYVKTFTEEQLDAILAFYKTPAGTALLEKMPQINTQFGELGNTRVAGLRDQLQKEYQALQSSLHPIPTLGPASPAPAAPAPGAAK